MSETSHTTAQPQPEEPPKLRDRTVKPVGTMPKQAQTYIIVGVSVVILLAVMFSKNHTQSAAKTELKDPTFLIAESNDRRISAFGQEMIDQQRAAQKAQLEKQLNVQVRSLESAPQPMPASDPQQVGSVQGAPPSPPPDPLVTHERELVYNSRFASNFAFSAEHTASSQTSPRDKTAKGRERPHRWLPRVGGRAGRSRPLAVERGLQQDQKQISPVSRTDRDQISDRRF